MYLPVQIKFNQPTKRNTESVPNPLRTLVFDIFDSHAEFLVKCIFGGFAWRK